MRIFFICVCLCHTVMSVSCCLVVTCWERADLLAFLYVMFSWFFCHFPIQCPGSGVLQYASSPVSVCVGGGGGL